MGVIDLEKNEWEGTTLRVLRKYSSIKRCKTRFGATGRVVEEEE